MTAETIHILSASIPKSVMDANTLGGRLSYNPDLGYDPVVCRFISSYRDLNFGWQYARMTAAHDLPVIGGLLLGADEVLWRAHLYCRDPRRYAATDIQMALALASNDMQVPKAAIEGLLLAKDATHESVARALNLPEEVILAYEILFFNVLDRKKDTLYLQSILYPHGRLVEMMQDYLQRGDFRALVRRAGYHNGPEDVMYLVGVSNDAVEAVTKANSPQKLEALMMSVGYMLARNGGMGSPQMQHARQLLQAGKLGGEQTDTRLIGLDAGQILRNELLRFAAPVAAMSR